MPVLAHFINNLIGVIVGYLMANYSEYDHLDSIGVNHSAWLSLVCTLLFLPIVWFIYKQRETRNSLISSKDEATDL
jgi:cbb3-type cytochrome oxidase subunit 3